MKKYKHIFFDLDRTLWDLEANSSDTLQGMYDRHQLKERGIPSFEIFITEYKKINYQLWDDYREGKVSKEFLRDERFNRTLRLFGIDDHTLAEKLGSDYVYYSPRQTKMFPNTLNTLEYLESRYQLHIITNGFEEVQQVKMECSGLNKFFDKVITSEQAGFKKPSPEIFEYAVQQAGANKEDSLMIGDDFAVDIVGASKYGMDQVFFNIHEEKHELNPTHMIKDLKELIEIL
jgi:putative hydrolase of the HAD superfamily